MPNVHPIWKAAADYLCASGASAIVEGYPPAIPSARPARIERPVSPGNGLTIALSPRQVHTGSTHVTTGVRYASFGARVAAAVIDFVILQVASAFISAVFVGQLLGSLTPTTILAATIGPVLVGGLLALGYSVWLESSAWQATPGKMMLGLKVVDLQCGRISFGRSSLRNLAKGFSLLTMGVGYLMPLWNSRRQALHDRAAECLVIYAA